MVIRTADSIASIKTLEEVTELKTKILLSLSLGYYHLGGFELREHGRYKLSYGIIEYF